MASLLRALARRLPFGSARFQKGSDLANNVYLEYPAPDGDPDPRRTRRLVKYAIHRELGEHSPHDIPVQWSMWLRHTRRDAPTLEELQEDQLRIQRTLAGARAIEEKDRRWREERRLRLEAQSAGPSAGIEAPPPGGEHEVWAASRARVAAQDGVVPPSATGSAAAPPPAAAPAPAPSAPATSLDHAIAARAERRAARAQTEAGISADNRDDEEWARARARIERSPLSDFDIVVEDGAPRAAAAPAPAPAPAPPRQAEPEAPAPTLRRDFGKATGPDETWTPHAFGGKPKARR